jgi:imidazole glycerol phosphate synthase subunit HisF
MKLESKSFMLTLTEDVQIGELKVTLIAQVMGTKEGFDIEFMDQIYTSYMGIPIEGYLNWKKFRDFHKEMGIDFTAHLQTKFDEIFTIATVKKYVTKIEF